MTHSRPDANTVGERSPAHERLTAAMLARPGILALCVGVIFLASLAALPFLRAESGMSAYMDDDAPLMRQMRAIEAGFVNDDLLFVLYTAPDVFAHDVLAATRTLTEHFEDLTLEDGSVYPIDDTTSLTNVDDLVGSDMMFRNAPLVGDDIPDDSESLEAIRTRAQGNVLIAGNLVSEKSDAAIIILRLQSDLDDKRVAMTVGKVRALMVASKTENIRYQLIGASVLNTDIVAYQAEDLSVFVPVVYAILGLLLFALIRRARGVLLGVAAAFTCLVAAMAGLVVTGGTLTNTSVMLPPAALALTGAILVHFFTEYGKNGLVGDDVAQSTLSDLLPPVTMAALTTAIGFACLSVSTIPAVRDFGIAAGLAMVLSLLICTTIMAWAFARWKPSQLIAPEALALSTVFQSSLDRLGHLLVRRPKPLFALSIALLGVLGWGATRVVSDQNDLEFFHSDAPIRVATKAMEARFGGSNLIVVAIEGTRDGQFTDPQELARIEALTDFMQEDMPIYTVVSAVDMIKLMHREFYNGAPEKHTLPDTAQQISQLLILNGGDTLEEYLDGNHRRVRIVARTDEHQARGLTEIYERIDQYLAEHFPAPDYETHAVAQSRVMASLATTLVRSQILSISLSALLIFGLMFLMLRSIRLGLFSLLPNVFPILATLGVMGWFDIELNAATVMISTVALGIAVDDTIHFMQHLRTRLVRHGDTELAIRETVSTKGPAIIATSTLITCAFAALIFSNFVPTRQFALLMCIAMVSALLGDLLILPSFLMIGKRTLHVFAPSDCAQERSSK